jgi:4-amino-4-deoxy-L-arabinose transferase-like glycosyltransferase
MSREAPALVSRPFIQRGILPGLLAVALVARLTAALLAGGDTFRFMDEVIYSDAAARLRSGAGFAADYAHIPGYPVFLAVLGLVVPSSVLGLRVGQALLVALGGILCFDLGRRLGGRSAALAAAALYSMDPLLVVSAGLLYPEATAALLLTGSLLAAWEEIQRNRMLLVLIAGVQLGALTLFRPVGLALAPVMIGWVGLVPGYRWSRRAAYVAVLIGAWILVLLPWTHRQYQLHDRILAITLAGAHGVPVIGAEMERSGVGAAVVAAIQRDPPGFTRRTIREFGHFWEFYPARLVTDDSARRAGLSQRDPRLASTPFLRRSARDVVSALSFGLELALAGIGLAVGWRDRRRETVWLVGLVLSFALGYSMFYGKLRYRIPILPIVLAFAGLGMATVAGELKRWRASESSRRAHARLHC